MTVAYRKDPEDLRNYFAELVRGVGHRGSSMSDVDRLCWTHDGKTNRFLFMDFKNEAERELSSGQRWALEALAKQPNVTVWFARYLGGDRIRFGDMGQSQAEEISGSEFKQRFHEWWEAS